MENTSLIQRGGGKTQNFNNHKPMYFATKAKESCFRLRELVEQDKAGRGYFGHNRRGYRQYVVCEVVKRVCEKGGV